MKFHSRKLIKPENLNANNTSQKTIISIDKIVFVRVDNDEKPKPHGFTLEDIKAIRS